MNKKYQLFISSTYKDLTDAREEVIKVILNMYHIPIGMEMFSADDEDQWDTIQETINSSDYYILIIGHRYGSETKEGISYTEKEFDYAKSTGVPIYAYIRDREAFTKPSERDRESEKVGKLEAFVKKVEGSGKYVEYWNTPSELGQKLAIAMPKAFGKKPRVGWVRADIISADTLNEQARLIMKNRELEETVMILNERLLQVSSVEKKSPVLKVIFDEKDKIQLVYPQNVYIRKLLYFASYEAPSELDSEAKIFYNSHYADKFNDWLRNNKSVAEEYNENVTKNERMKGSHRLLTVGLKNEGNLKANDIFATIKFPEEILVVESTAVIQNLEVPYPANAPKHPVVLAEEALARRNSNTWYPYTATSKPDISVSTPPYTVSVKGNTVHISLKSLLHTQSKTFLDHDYKIGIMATQAGQYLAQVQIICEELSEPIKYKIPIAVD